MDCVRCSRLWWVLMYPAKFYVPDGSVWVQTDPQRSLQVKGVQMDPDGSMGTGRSKCVVKWDQMDLCQ